MCEVVQIMTPTIRCGNLWTRTEQAALHVTREWQHRSGRIDVCAILDSGPIHDTNHYREMRMMIWTAAVQASVVHIVAQMVIGK